MDTAGIGPRLKREAMHRSRAPAAMKNEGSTAACIARCLLRFAWGAVRLPIFSLLLIFEPIVRLVLSWLTLLAVLTAFLFEFSGAAPSFPFWGMISFSVGCALVLTAYYALLSMLSR